MPFVYKLIVMITLLLFLSSTPTNIRGVKMKNMTLVMFTFKTVFDMVMTGYVLFFYLTKISRNGH